MADKKISGLTSATTPLAGTELVPIVQSGATVSTTVSAFGAIGNVLTNANKVEVYNSGVGTANYERGKLLWESNVLKFGTEKGGTGTARALELQTDGTSWVSLSTTGLIRLHGTSSSYPALKRNATGIDIRLADDSAAAPLTASTLQATATTANTSAIAASSYSLTGSDATAMVDLSGTWNTSGTPTLWKVNITDTASNAASLLLDLQVGGASKFSVSKAGVVTATNLANGRTVARFTPLDNQPPASNFATLDTRNSIATLDFDDSTAESAVFVGVLPESATTSSGIMVRLFWAATSATSGNVKWGVSFEKYGTDIDSDSFDTETTAYTACSGTSGIVVVTEITATTIDSLAAGDQFRLKIRRVADDATYDTMTGDAELIAVAVRQVA